MKISKDFYKGFNKLFGCPDNRLSYDELNKNLIIESYKGIKSDWEAVGNDIRKAAGNFSKK